MRTEIFKNYEEFDKREDKEINGVSLKLAKEYTNYIEDNKTNKG